MKTITKAISLSIIGALLLFFAPHVSRASQQFDFMKTYANTTIRDVTTDSQGNIYTTGGTTNPNYPTTTGAYDTTHNGNMDVFVTKYSPTGSIIWSTFVGGTNYDRAYGIEVDASGIYIGGRAGQGFPVSANAFQRTFQGNPNHSLYGPQDGFIAKLSPNGSQLYWASYFGGYDEVRNIVRDLDIDSSGNVYIFASTNSNGFSTMPTSITDAFQSGYDPTYGGGVIDAVAAKIASDGSAVQWATFVGGSGEDWGEGSIRVDSNGDAYVLIATDSTNMRTSANAYDRTHNGDADFYITKINTNGGFVWGTYLGGSGLENVETHQLAIDSTGNAYVAAGSRSSNYPTTATAYDRTYNGSGENDAVASKISSDGSTLLGSTYLGGSGGEFAEGVAVAPDGTLHVVGRVHSSNFPTTADAYRSAHNGSTDAFFAILSADFQTLEYGSYIGTASKTAGRDAALGPNNETVIGGESTTGGILIKFSPTSPTPTPTPTPTATQSPSATPTTTPAPGIQGDLNNDGAVTITDLGILLSNWGSTNATADINNNGSVDIQDLGILLSNWGSSQ